MGRRTNRIRRHTRIKRNESRKITASGIETHGKSHKNRETGANKERRTIADHGRERKTDNEGRKRKDKIEYEQKRK